MKSGSMSMIPFHIFVLLWLVTTTISFSPKSKILPIHNKQTATQKKHKIHYSYSCRQSHNRDSIDDDNNKNNHNSHSIKDPSPQSLARRSFFQQAVSLAVASSTATATVFSQPLQPANARGLIQFPCTTPLFNTYHIMRAGTTLLEEEDIWSTNPLFLTNAEAALSEKGRLQVDAAIQKLRQNNIQPSVIKYSLAASAMDTTAMVRDELKVGQNRVVPEFFFMDPRAIGKWDMMSYQQTLPAIIAMDELEAGKDGTGGRPPPNEDGTPNETLADNAVRLRQLISGIESQYSGDTVLLIFPDGTGPALLSAMIAGIPFNKVHELEFAPGEVRLDVTMASTLELYNNKVNNKEQQLEYQTVIQKGQDELSRLRSLKMEDIVSKKDLKLEKERIELEQEQERIARARKEQEEREKAARLQRAKELEQEKLARVKEMDEARMRDRGIITFPPSSGDNTINDSGSGSSITDNATIPPVLIGGVFATFVGVALAGTNDDDGNDTADDVNSETESNNGNITSMDTESDDNADTPQPDSSSGIGLGEMKNVSFDDIIKEQSNMNNNNTAAKANSTRTATDGSTTNPQSSDIPPPPPPPPTEAERAKAANQAMQAYLDQDDGGAAWLQAMTEIMNENDDADTDNSNSDDSETTRINGSDKNSFQ